MMAPPAHNISFSSGWDHQGKLDRQSRESLWDMAHQLPGTGMGSVLGGLRVRQAACKHKQTVGDFSDERVACWTRPCGPSLLYSNAVQGSHRTDHQYTEQLHADFSRISTLGHRKQARVLSWEIASQGHRRWSNRHLLPSVMITVFFGQYGMQSPACLPGWGIAEREAWQVTAICIIPFAHLPRRGTEHWPNTSTKGESHRVESSQQGTHAAHCQLSPKHAPKHIPKSAKRPRKNDEDRDGLAGQSLSKGVLQVHCRKHIEGGQSLVLRYATLLTSSTKEHCSMRGSTHVHGQPSRCRLRVGHAPG